LTRPCVSPERPEFANRQYVRQYRWPGAARGCEAFTPDFRLFTSIFCVWRPTSEHRIIERFRSNIEIPPCRLMGLCLSTIRLSPIMAAVRQGTGWELSYLALNFSIASADDRFPNLWTTLFLPKRFSVRLRYYHRKLRFVYPQRIGPSELVSRPIISHPSLLRTAGTDKQTTP
jgi:hypothetical protein